VPRLNADGNETVGVASVLYHAPLGTYLGWNAIRSGILAGQGCGYTGGYLPFAKTKAERLATGDPRLSVEERYGTQEGYVCTVQKAVARAVHERFLLPGDGRRLMGEVLTSKVLPPNAASSHENLAVARARCGP
jgi:hypothetical protein